MLQASELSTKFEEALLYLDRVAASEILDSVESSGSAFRLLEDIMIPAMKHIGDKWESGAVSLSQVYMSGVICEELAANLAEPGSGVETDQKASIALVTLEDHHFLGKSIVSMILRANGVGFIDYHGLTVSELVGRLIEDNMSIVLISTLLLPSALRVKDVRAGLESRGAEVKIVVGGAPYRFDPELWKDVGADAMCSTASEVIEALERVSGEK